MIQVRIKEAQSAARRNAAASALRAAGYDCVQLVRNDRLVRVWIKR